jgi:hypothetical protein
MTTAGRPLIVALTSVIATATIVACGSGGSSAARLAPRAVTTTRVQSAAAFAAAFTTGERSQISGAVTRGVGFVGAHLASVEAHSLVVFDYLRRNWRLSGLRGVVPLARRRASQATADDPLVRLVVPRRRPSRRTVAAAVGTDRRLAVALECDRTPYPSSYRGDLARAAARGGLDLTHAAFAIRFTEDLGCRPPVSAAQRRAIVDGLRAAVSTASAVDDLSLEQGAMLVALNKGAAVPGDFVRRVVAAQRPDGGWAAGVAPESSWHATGLALWVLSGALSPGRGVAMVRS